MQELDDKFTSNVHRHLFFFTKSLKRIARKARTRLLHVCFIITHYLLYPQIPNSTSTSAHQGLALFSYVRIAVVDIREKHLKLLLRKLTYMTWSISKVLFFKLISFSFDLLGEKSLEKLHLKILTCSLMKNALKQLLVGKIQSRNRILFFIYLNWQKLVNSNKLGYKSKAVKWHKIVYYYFFGTGNGRSALYTAMEN